jgi:hypothetical protein
VKVLIISAQDLHVPSGIPQMINHIIGGLLSRGVSVTAVLPKNPDGLGLYKPATEYYDSKNGRLAVEWLPAADFGHNGRENLLHYLETLIVREDVEHILAVGVRKAGFISSIAARLRGKHFSAILTYRDAFECHLNTPHELDLVTEAAKFLIAPNPFVLQHLECFYSLGDRACWLETLPHDLDSEFIDLEEDLRYRETVSQGQTYLCTTGHISALVDVGELLDRVTRLMHESGADRWIHVGTMDPNTLVHLSNRLALLGMTNHFSLTDILDRSRYRCLVQGARVVVKPAGEVDTGVGAIEANGWEVPLSVPPEYPISPLKPYPHRSEFADPHRSPSSCVNRLQPTSLDVVLDRFLQ